MTLEIFETLVVNHILEIIVYNLSRSTKHSPKNGII